MENKIKLTYCGSCPLCSRMLTLITVTEYFTNEFRGYRGYCESCKAKSEETYNTIEDLINDHDKGLYDK